MLGGIIAITAVVIAVSVAIPITVCIAVAVAMLIVPTIVPRIVVAPPVVPSPGVVHKRVVPVGIRRTVIAYTIGGAVPRIEKESHGEIPPRIVFDVDALYRRFRVHVVVIYHRPRGCRLA